MRTHTIIDSPVGEITLTAHDGVLSGLYIWEPAQRPADLGPDDPPAFADTIAQLGEYFAGRRTGFDVPMVLSHGTEFQQRVWRALLDIPFGETTTYAALAARLGKPSASRAVGLANGRNPISVIVPCHRVIGSGGALTGYGWGLPRKRWLLDHERAGARLF